MERSKVINCGEGQGFGRGKLEIGGVFWCDYFRNDVRLVIKVQGGKRVWECREGRCGQWFVPEGETLK
ncbi:MAG: hypothetical protein UX78_C0011G0011 [Candidatus Amesbacteria bacterium GW2011_GWA2_47_11]|uniref:Uncharacterized protein n=2 Tax=Candidatus Amesiibacteriota TaxID=1752730 RepID=A0A0G1RFX6_9BACT|nr:MAG: hypothetical protein UX78_C0011G0011 [Candidatus Amesbacteria bacterium GW2011_GWA2_47_11]KKU99149.1 MAG: hypothetical protein UY33_C0036G0009 [Candidatus Amesbacteria bacterium GW2011_GWA1_48_9]